MAGEEEEEEGKEEVDLHVYVREWVVVGLKREINTENSPEVGESY